MAKPDKAARSAAARKGWETRRRREQALEGEEHVYELQPWHYVNTTRLSDADFESVMRRVIRRTEGPQGRETIIQFDFRRPNSDYHLRKSEQHIIAQGDFTLEAMRIFLSRYEGDWITAGFWWRDFGGPIYETI